MSCFRSPVISMATVSFEMLQSPIIRRWIALFVQDRRICAAAEAERDCAIFRGSAGDAPHTHTQIGVCAINTIIFLLFIWNAERKNSDRKSLQSRPHKWQSRMEEPSHCDCSAQWANECEVLPRNLFGESFCRSCVMIFSLRVLWESNDNDSLIIY